MFPIIITLCILSLPQQETILENEYLSQYKQSLLRCLGEGEGVGGKVMLILNNFILLMQ